MQIKIEVSARHIHLSREHLDKLFGEGYELKKFRDLSLPGQFAAEEKVTIAGPRSRMEGVRLTGPLREKTQVEISKTDARTLGIDPPVRESGQLENSGKLKLIGPAGELDLDEGAIIAMRHIHFDPEMAKKLKMEAGDLVSVKVDGERSLIFNNVIVRIDPDFLEVMHIDTDEANAAGIDENNNTGLLIN